MPRLPTPAYTIFFDAAATQQRVGVLKKAIAAGKHIYSEKPVAPTVAQANALLRAAEARGLRHGAVEDKVYLPGMQKLARLTQSGELGRIVGFRLEFGWWVFDGTDRPGQRPSWNYRRGDGGGGLILDMYPHWRYVIETIVGRIARVSSAAWTAVPERIDEDGRRYRGRCRGRRRDPGGAGGRSLRHHSEFVGEPRAARRLVHPAGRRHQRLGARRPAPLPCAISGADAGRSRISA